MVSGYQMNGKATIRLSINCALSFDKKFHFIQVTKTGVSSNDYRVSLLPSVAKEFTSRGLQVLVNHNAWSEMALLIRCT